MALLNEFSLQLYSVRSETDKDFFGTLKQVGDIGYNGVEFAGYKEIPAKEMKKALDDNGLKSVGSHIRIERMESILDEELEYNQTLGSHYIVCPNYKYNTRDGALELAEKLIPIAEKATKAGFTFAYHNHAHEFIKDGDDYLLDILFNNVPAELMKMELDLYWAVYAGVDVASFMKKYFGRLELLHIKQIKDNESKECVDLNEGILDFYRLISDAKEAGVNHFILEQEKFAVSPITSIKNGYDYIMGL